jgi:O-antigen ligase
MIKHNLFSFFSSDKLFNLSFVEQQLFFLTIATIPTQLGKHFWPDFAAIFSIRTDYFSPTIYLWDLIVVLLLITFFIQGKRLKALPLFLLLFFCLFQAFSLSVAENVGAGVVRLQQYFLSGLFGVYVAGYNLNKIKKSLFWGLIVGVFYSSVIGIFQVMMGKTVGLWILGERSFNLTTLSIATFDWYGQVFLRAYAAFPHPNVLAAFLITALALLFFLQSFKDFTRQKEILFGAFLIGSSALFLTFSRVALVLYSLLFIYLLHKRLKLLLIIFLLLLPFLYVRFNSAFNFDHLSFLRREELAIQSLEMFRTAPLLGVGLNNFVYVLAYGDIISGEHRFLQPVHNIFLLTLAETGIIGLFSLFVFLVPALRKLVLKFRYYKKPILILSYLWFCFLVIGMFDHYLLTLAQGQRIFFLVWGITMLEYSRERID